MAQTSADQAPAQSATRQTGGLSGIVSKVTKLKLVRVFTYYASRRGPLFAFGLSYQALFATFAALWVAFSIAGLVLQNDIGLRDSLIMAVSRSVPGLIDNGDGSGAVDPDVLLGANVFGWTGALALVILVATAIGWLDSARGAVREVFDVGILKANFALQKVKDLGFGVGFGIALLASTTLSAATTWLIGATLPIVGINSNSPVAITLGRIVGLLIVLAIDTLLLAAIYRLLARVPIPRRNLLQGALIGGVAIGLLKLLGGALIGGTGNNPLLASFAVIVGLLVWFNIVCQLILIVAAWIAVGMNDSGIPADPEAAEAARLQRERIAELERIAAEARRPGVFARLVRRLVPRRGEADRAK